MFLLFIESIIISSLLFIYLNYKVKVELKYLFIDNIIIAVVATIVSYLFNYTYLHNMFYALIFNIITVPVMLLFGILIRFYTVPLRKTKANENDI